MIQRNMIDVVTTNGCPDITPAQLLAESATEEDCRKLESVMGRFTSTTAFLNALKTVLEGLDAGPEVSVLDKFIPIMAQVESGAMNDNPVTLRVEEVSNTERILRILRSDDLTDYPRVENGELLNSGEVSTTVQQLHDYLGAPPSPNGE